MSFDRNVFNLDFTPSVKPEKIAQAQSIGELISVGKKYHNDFVFQDYGSDKKHDYQAIETESENEYEKWTLESVQIFQNFLDSPIMTDSFHDDHNKRRDWEDKYMSEFSSDAKKYYHSNRLGLNNCAVVIYCLKILSELEADQIKQDKLTAICSRIPSELIPTSKGTDGNGLSLKDEPVYNSLNDEQKINVVRSLSALAKDALVLIQNKK